MEVRQILKILFRWWWLAAIPIVVVIAYSGLTYRRPATTYQVVMRFTAGGEPATALSADYDRYYAWLSSEYIANALADVAVTGNFAEAIAKRLGDQGLSVAPGAIQAAIASDNAQSIFVIYLTWPDPQQITSVAEAVSAELTQNGAFFPKSKGGIAAQRVIRDADSIVPSLRAQLLGPELQSARTFRRVRIDSADALFRPQVRPGRA